ncbi:MAG: AI-2E family transporter [Polaromonas sp.]
MKQPHSTNTRSFENKFFVLLLLVVSLGFLWVLSPFYGAVFWGAVFAIVFAPLHARLLRAMPTRRTLTAALALLFILLLVIFPLALLSALLVQAAGLVFQRLQTGELNFSLYFQQIYDALPSWVSGLLTRFGLTDMGLVQERITLSLKQGSQFFATQALSIGQNTFDFLMSFFILLYLLFFFLRDGSALGRRMMDTLPLEGDIKRDLSGKFITVIRATVKGNIVVAMVQGALGGLIFWILDIHAPVLWGTLMAFLSLLPAIGAAIVWLPVAIYFLATGAVLNGFLLAAFGVLVIGLVDNVLRPLLVGKDTKLPDYVVLMSTIGGMALFGLNGFVIGPVIAAMFIAAWDLFSVSRQLEPLVPLKPAEPTEASSKSPAVPPAK